MRTLVNGSVAGFAATVPMTVVMKGLHTLLPPEEQYPLPPRAVTLNAIEKVGIDPPQSDSEQHRVTLAAHFGYGTAAGIAYGLTMGSLSGHPLAKGMGFGAGLWAGSYLGWLPAAGLLPSATRLPAARNALMIAAHLVWGACLGVAFDSMSKKNGRSE